MYIIFLFICKYCLFYNKLFSIQYFNQAQTYFITKKLKFLMYKYDIY